ncbi:MAG TPA: DUF3667 domain-containing protein [Chitinophagaceae bacterium]|nr:DUF3667 domain-containing protein [Chitinophagaceae bacterium]
MQEGTIVCKNCHNQFHGEYCNKCGEKVYTDHDKTLGHFLEESFHFFTHLDNKFFRSLWLVMTRPGFVSTQISHGIRKKYYKPLSLFIVGVILYLLFPVFQGLNTPMKYHLNDNRYGRVAQYIADTKMKNKHLTLEELAHKYDAKSPSFAKVLLLIIIPLSALALQLLTFYRKKYFFDQLTLASEINSFYLYFTFFVLPLLFILTVLVMRIFVHGWTFRLDDSILEPVVYTVVGAYTAIAFRRFYKEKMVWSIIKSALFLIAHSVIVYTIYRFILFCTVQLFI